MTSSSYVIKTLLMIGQALAFFMDPMPPCGSDCEYDESDLRLSCAGLALTCIPKPCCIERTRFVDLSMNNLTTIGPIAFQSLPNLHSLDVRLNSIESLSRWAFQGLRYLQILDLRENKLTLLRSGIFEGLLNMKTLTLSRNRINDIQPGTFRLLPNLKTLRLNHNLLQVVYPDTFAQLTELITLDLSSNNIHTVYYGSFNTLIKLEFLSLASNKIASLPVFLESLEDLDHLNLKGNPLFCDCSLEFVRLWFRERDSSYKKSGVCSQPEEFKDRVLASINTQLFCETFDESVYDTLFNSLEETIPTEDILNNSGFDDSTTETTYHGITSNGLLTNSVTHKYNVQPTSHATINMRTVYVDVTENALTGAVADSRRATDLTLSHKDVHTTKDSFNSKTQDIASSHATLTKNIPMSPYMEETLTESTVTSSPVAFKTEVFYENSPQFTHESLEGAKNPSYQVTSGTTHHPSKSGSTTGEPMASQKKTTNKIFSSTYNFKKTSMNGQRNAMTEQPITDHYRNKGEELHSTEQDATVSLLGASQETYDYNSIKSIQSSNYTPDSNYISPSLKLPFKPDANLPVSERSRAVNDTNLETETMKHFLSDTAMATTGRTINVSHEIGDSGTLQTTAGLGDPSVNIEDPAKAPLRGFLEVISESPGFEEMTPTPDPSYTDGFTTMDYDLNEDTFITSLENGSVEADMTKFIMMGESVQVKCPLSHLALLQHYLSYYRTKWLSPSGQWIDDSIARFTVSRQGFLTINDVSPSDNGIYRCVRAQYMSDPSIASVDLRVSCPCQKIPEMKYSTDESTTKQATITTPMTSSLRKVTSSSVPDGNEYHTEQKYCNRVPVAVAVLITFQATMALCILTFCAYLSWRSSRNRRNTNRPESYLERPRTVSEVNYYDSGEPLNRTSEVPTIVYESTGDEEVVEENNVADSSESDSALSMSGSHRHSALDSEYVNAQTLTRDRSSTYADLDPHSRSRHDTYSSLHREDDESPE